MTQKDPPLEQVFPEYRRMLHRHWVERLYDEYDHLCFMYRLELDRPVLRVDDLPGRWGTWDLMTRTICLSTRLIEEHPWDVVLEILKHEIAHQIADELYGADEAHGPCFQSACRKLGVAAWAARAETDLARPLDTAPKTVVTSEEERLLARVEKLLRLASSANEHEALLAMQKVQELYGKYNLERIESRRRTPHASLVIRTRKKRMDRYHYLACSILSDHFFVEVIHTSLFDAKDLVEYKAVELLGTPENVLMAEYVYHFLLNQAGLLWNDFRRELTGGRGRTARASYLLGVLSGFRDKLEAHKHMTEARGGVALVAAEDVDLDDYVAYRYPRLVRLRGGKVRRDADSFERGQRQGREIVLHKGVGESVGNRGRLLGR